MDGKRAVFKAIHTSRQETTPLGGREKLELFTFILDATRKLLFKLNVGNKKLSLAKGHCIVHAI